MDEQGSRDEVRTQVLLEEYKEAMESQRANTSVVYSWVGSIFLVLSTGLFFYGMGLEEMSAFVPALALALVLAAVWWGLTESFVFYMRQRFARIHEIEKELGMRLMSGAGEEIRALGWRARFLEARTYVRVFIVAYLGVWILALVLKF